MSGQYQIYQIHQGPPPPQQQQIIINHLPVQGHVVAMSPSSSDTGSYTTTTTTASTSTYGSYSSASTDGYMQPQQPPGAVHIVNGQPGSQFVLPSGQVCQIIQQPQQQQQQPQQHYVQISHQQPSSQQTTQYVYQQQQQQQPHQQQHNNQNCPVQQNLQRQYQMQMANNNHHHQQQQYHQQQQQDYRSSSNASTTVGERRDTQPADLRRTTNPTLINQRSDSTASLMSMASGNNSSSGGGIPTSGKIPFLASRGPCKYINSGYIGHGSFGNALMVKRQSDGLVCVAKKLDLSNMTEQGLRYARMEIQCMAKTEHPNCVRFIEEHLTEDSKTIYLIMELVDAGDVWTQMIKQGVHFGEYQVNIIFVQLLLALHYLHGKRMLHRDVKSSNLFINTSGTVKLGDFGFARMYDEDISGGVANTFLGTPYYLAPEMWKGVRYGKQTDIWAAGCVLYELITGGGRAFEGATQAELRQRVCNRIVDPLPETTSKELVDLLESILIVDPSKRPSAIDLLRTRVMRSALAAYNLNVVAELKDENQRKEALYVVEHVREEIDRIDRAEGVKLPNAQQEVRLTSLDNHTSAAAKKKKDDIQIVEEANGDFSSPVKVESGSTLKERVLILTGHELLLSLPKGKEAMPGTERVKRLALARIQSATVVDDHPQFPNLFFIIVRILSSSSAAGNSVALGFESKSLRDAWADRFQHAMHK